MDLLSLKNLITFTNYDENELNNRGISMKGKELETFVGFVEHIIEESLVDNEDLYLFSDNFFTGYTIPQISKEFDFLRLGENYNINIELKSSSSLEKQKVQLEKNYYYLKFLQVPTLFVSFSLDEQEFVLAVGKNDEFKYLDPKKVDLQKIFKYQKYTTMTKEKIDSNFDIKNYLVSPFNNTKRFIKNEYFLTDHQVTIKSEVISSKEQISLIEGGPGTGKSLLLYDIAKELTHRHSKDEVAVIHCGSLNHGHELLKYHGINVLAAHECNVALNNKNLKFLLVDESQRFYPAQLDYTFRTLAERNIRVVFSIDQEQAFDKLEVDWNNKETILSKFSDFSGKKYKLKNKFRSNKELANFITKLSLFEIDMKKMDKIPNYNNNISIRYFHDNETAVSFISKIKNEFQILSYSASRYDGNDPFRKTPRIGPISHEILGQEFDKVAIIIDRNFQYFKTSNNTKYKLYGTNKSYYLANKMFYQNVTRAKEQLLLIVIKNEDFFLKATSLLDNI